MSTPPEATRHHNSRKLWTLVPSEPFRILRFQMRHPVEYRHVPRLEICKLVNTEIKYLLMNWLLELRNKILTHIHSRICKICVSFIDFFSFLFQVKTTKNKANLDPCPEPVITDLSWKSDFSGTTEKSRRIPLKSACYLLRQFIQLSNLTNSRFQKKLLCN